MRIRIRESIKCQANTHYPTPKFLKRLNAENLLELLDAISCMNGRKTIMLSMGGKGKQNAEKEKKIENIKWQINDVI